MAHKLLEIVLENAIRYEGKASVGSILGKLISADPQLKDNKEIIKKVSQEVAQVVKQVNAMTKEQQLAEFEKLGGKLTEKEKKEKTNTLPKLRDVGRPIVLRFEPSPSGPLHIGHAYVFGLNYQYAQEYKGKLILRIADTNASNINTQSYELIPIDANWLTNNGVNEFIIQSDRIDIYYDYVLKFIEKGHVYICTCSADEFKAISKRKEECPCRNHSKDENIKRWHDMFTKYNEGDAVLRFKSDMKHPNPAMRDFPLFRINDDEHPRTGKKYRLWPLMNFAVLVDDHELGVTHILRAKDHADNAKRQEMMYKSMGWDVPETLFVGRINFEDMEISCSKTKERIMNGEFSGWEDIRLPFLPALRRRGYQPEAFIKYAIDVGVSLNDKSVSREDFFKTINFNNKQVLEPKAHRFFFVAEPVAVKIKDAPEIEVELDLHPDYKKGGRVFHSSNEFYLAKDDVDGFEDNRLYRLMDCINFTVSMDKPKTAADKPKVVVDKTHKYDCKYHSVSFEEVKGKAKLIHWLPKKEAVKVEVLMDDNTIVKGFGEKGLDDLKEGDIVQFVRFGFCRLDKIEPDKMIFWFTHK